MGWMHEDYPEGRIRDYVNGIGHDLESVTANEGHVLVKDSIMEQAKRLADIAVHNVRYRKEWFGEVRDKIMELARLRSADAATAHGDGGESLIKAVPIEELETILSEVTDAIGDDL